MNEITSPAPPTFALQQSQLPPDRITLHLVLFLYHQLIPFVIPYQRQANNKGHLCFITTIDLAEFDFAELLIQKSKVIDRVDNFDDFDIRQFIQ